MENVVKIEVRDVYGNELIYPANFAAEKFALIKLTLDANNRLAIPLATPDEFGRNEATLIVCYPEGDYDTIGAENFDGNNLRRALFDEREIGTLPADCDCVELPSGVLFFF